MTTTNAIVKHCYGTAAAWTSADPILLAGEVGIESDTGKAKLGDGTSHYSALDYWIDFASLGDPGADRLVFWDESANAYSYATATGGLDFSTTNFGPASTNKATIWVPASAMISRTTNGAAAGTVETTTNKVMVKTLDFDSSTAEYAQFSVAFPNSWNLGTVTFTPVWSHPSTTTNFGVVWSLAGVALSDDDAADTAFGTVQTSTDTGGTTNDIYVGPTSSAITIAGSPADGDLVVFQVARVPSDGSDTMAVDARLHGVKITYTYDTFTDA